MLYNEVILQMRLTPLVKKVRGRFSEYKIRQLTNEFNKIYALFVLPNSIEQLTLTLERDYIVLKFGNLVSAYGYSESDFDYMAEEIESLLMCKTCVMSVYENSEYCGCMLAYDNEINEKFLETEIRRFHYEKFNTENFENGYVELVYTDADKERCIYFKANCVYL